MSEQTTAERLQELYTAAEAAEQAASVAVVTKLAEFEAARDAHSKASTDYTLASLKKEELSNAIGMHKLVLELLEKDTP